ncbi:MAG TPA: MurR/RpiR family transcriptional regulator [Clostridiales bacterium]|nr:MurR/RpiR family transcriptional regulator [Clostridiales bacterium]
MDNNRNVLLIIKSLYPSLHRVEKKIAGFILENPETIIYMPIAQMAKDLEVAESSIVRFCKIIGFDGFKQLKISLVKSLENPEKIIYEDINKNDSQHEIINKVFSSSIRTLQESLQTIDENQFTMAVEAMLKAKRIEFYGVGTSSTLAQDAYYRFMRIGLPVYAVVDPHVCRVSASTMDNTCLAIAISYKGRTRDTVETLEIAKSKGARTMCITCFPQSPITKVSDIQIIMPTSEAKIMREAISSRIAQIAIIDSLYTAVALEKFDTVVDHIEDLSDILSSVRL